MISIVDYGVGNLFSLKSSFDAIGAETVVTRDKKIIENSEKIVFPGVGAFEDAVKKLHSSGLSDVILREAEKGKPILGICLGMQLLFQKSYENGTHFGLGLIKGEIRPIKDTVPPDYKIPHIGWNKLNITDKNCKIFKYINSGDYVYFVHSYFGADCDESVTATAEYGTPLTAAVASGNVFGCQFHPEKSGETGLNILRGFCS